MLDSLQNLDAQTDWAEQQFEIRSTPEDYKLLLAARYGYWEILDDSWGGYSKEVIQTAISTSISEENPTLLVDIHTYGKLVSAINNRSILYDLIVVLLKNDKRKEAKSVLSKAMDAGIITDEEYRLLDAVIGRI